jgi:hypothetical protein
MPGQNLGPPRLNRLQRARRKLQIDLSLSAQNLRQANGAKLPLAEYSNKDDHLLGRGGADRGRLLIHTTAVCRAASILDEIERLQAQYGAMIDGTASRRGRKPGPQPKAEAAEAPGSPEPARNERRKKRKISPEARARMVAAAKARWARVKARK